MTKKKEVPPKIEEVPPVEPEEIEEESLETPEPPKKSTAKTLKSAFNPMEGIPEPQGPPLDLGPLSEAITRIETTLGEVTKKLNPAEPEPKKEATPKPSLQGSLWFDEFELF